MEKDGKIKKEFKLPKIESWLRIKLRRISLQWPARTEALRKSRIERGIYQCSTCKGKFKANQVHVDHIEAVIPMSGYFTNWDEYIKRLFVDVSGLQILCQQCHSNKTELENSMRKFYRKKRKKRGI